MEQTVSVRAKNNGHLFLSKDKNMKNFSSAETETTAVFQHHDERVVVLVSAECALNYSQALYYCL